MQHTEPGELSYTELERRIKALPEGPANVFTTPRPFAIAGVIGNIGIILGLLPSLLATFMTPQMWMVWVAQFGLGTAILGCAPEFFRSLWVVARGTYRWRLDQVTQLDHDLVQFRTLIAWLRRFPTAVLLEHLRFAHRVRTRLSMKIGLLSGGLDKLGVVPVLIALGIQVKALADWGQTPTWQILIGLFLSISYLVALMGAFMRLRLQLYESVLEEALEARTPPARGPET
jgi:hypothetical protein